MKLMLDFIPNIFNYEEGISNKNEKTSYDTFFKLIYIYHYNLI